jgi:hypothetical protein
MNIDDLELNLYLYNPSDKEDIQKLINSYPEFSVELANLEKDRERLIQYIIIFYDKNSEVKNRIKDLFQRKASVAQMVGFRLDKNGKFKETIKECLLGQNDSFNSMCIKYMMLFNNPDIAMLEVMTDLYAKELAKSLKTTPKTPSKDVKETLANIDQLNKQINIKTESIFGGQEPRKLEEKLYYYMEQERLRLSPEDIARKIQDGERITNIDPYNLYDEA